MQLGKETETLGERLQRERESLGLSLEEIARRIQTTAIHIKALEENDYEIFSAKIYALGFFKKLLGVLALSDKDDLLKEFNNEWEVRMFRKNKGFLPLPENRGKEPYFTPVRFWLGLGTIFLLLILIFLYWRFANFVLAPELELQEPQEQSAVEQPIIQIKGRTEKESRLTVNGRDIKIDGQGNFKEEIEAGPGLNRLEFVTQNRFGKESRVIRNILVK